MMISVFLLALAVGAFADTGVQEDSHIYDVCVTHVKPEHWYDFKNELKKHPAFEAKHGIEVMGRYKPIAGGIGDLITFLKFDSMTARVGKLKEIFEDADFKAHHEKNAHFIDDITVTTSKVSSLFPVHPPAPTSFVHIHKVHVKGFPRDNAQAFKEFFDAAYEKHMKPKGMNLIGVWRPIYGRNVNSYTVGWELTGDHPLDVPKQVVAAIMADESLKPLSAKVWANVIRRESYLLAPINLNATTF